MKRALCGAILFGSCLPALEITPVPAGFRVRSRSMELTIRRGTIIELRDVRNGAVWSDARRRTGAFPRGLGIIRSLSALRRGHMLWGVEAMNRHISPDFPRTNYFLPDRRSKFDLTRSGDLWTARWQGLNNGDEFLPDASWAYTFREGDDGRIGIQIEGNYPGGKVFGAALPLANVDPSSELLIPYCGGRVFGQGKPSVQSFSQAPRLDAPIGIFMKPGRTLAMWMEDATWRPHYLFFRRTEAGFGLTMEVNPLMPFEKRTNVSTPVIWIQTFDGDWRTAAAPYRNWYRKVFSREMAARDAITWAGNIFGSTRNISWMATDQDLDDLMRFFPRDSIIIMEYNARTPGWDKELPDWTPRPGYLEFVRRAKKHGLKTMAYMNICCANYDCPVWRRDRLGDFFLTRKNRIQNYKMADSSRKERVNDLFSGTVDYADGVDQFKNIQPGKLLYGDLLSKGWREYHANMMKWWHETTGTDANYEDTAGTTNDHGNGVIDGLSAGMGDTEQMRLLLKTQPVPMTGEFAPAAIAFGLHWVMSSPAAFGSVKYLRGRLHSHRPLSAYLFGVRPFTQPKRGYDNMYRHLQLAYADACGGFGVIPIEFYLGRTKKEIEHDYSMEGHAFRRAVLFAEKKLKPYFDDPAPYPPHLISRYKGTDGIYSYFDNGTLQEMHSPAGIPVYGRVNGTEEVETTLWIPGWPYRKGNRIFGLNPKMSYALFPRNGDCVSPDADLPEIKPGVRVRQYWKTPHVTYLLLSDEAASVARISAPAPEPYLVPRLEIGLASQTPRPLSSVPKDKDWSRLPQGYSTVVWPIAVKEKNAVLEVEVRDRANIHTHPHDGTVFTLKIDGKTVERHDTALRKKLKWTADREQRRLMFDLTPRKWRIPLAPYDGKTILVTLETSPAENRVADRPQVRMALLPGGK